MIRGITKVRNEAHILKDTLDSWATVADAIHVYCDACTDRMATAEIAQTHPAVVEVIESDLHDPDRERAEWFTRRWVLHSALRFCKKDDWIVYFDGDEILEQFDRSVLDPDRVQMVACRSFDSYITPEDADYSEWDFHKRQYVGQEYQFAPYFYSCRLHLDFYKPDQRNIELPPGTPYALEGYVRHWGKGLSVRKWEEKCKYYTEVFGPRYAAKWEKRKGQAIKTDMMSDFGQPLVLWKDILTGQVEGRCWNGTRRMPLIR